MKKLGFKRFIEGDFSGRERFCYIGFCFLGRRRSNLVVNYFIYLYFLDFCIFFCWGGGGLLFIRFYILF